VPWYGSGIGITTVRESWLAAGELGAGDVVPRMAVRACGAYRGGGCEGECGVNLSGGQGQRPFGAVGDTAGVAVGHGKQALGLGRVFGTRHRSFRWLNVLCQKVIAGLVPVDTS
jgi:hypothetical protein